MLTLKQYAQRMSANVWFKNPFQILPPKKKKPLSAVSSEAIRMLNWTRHYYILNQLPTSSESLSKLPMGDLRLIACHFKPYIHDQMRDANQDELIKFILGHQHNIEMYHPLEPLPFGSLPDIRSDYL